MAWLGDYPANGIVRVLFTTVKACGVPVALASGAARVLKNGATGLHATGVALTASLGSITGLNRVVVTTSAGTTLYTSGDYDVILSTGSVNGINVRGYLLGSFSIKARTSAKVWSETTRTLTSGSAVASSVWAASSRTLTSGANVWTAATRTLTSGGAVSDSVWVETARTLTSGATVASSVWAAASRLLTSGAAVWAAGTKVLTSGAVMWTAAGRTLSSGATVWTAATRTLTSGANVWTAGTRTLTSGANVWTAGTRTLTSGDAAADSVWAATTRTLTSGDTVASSVWVDTTRTLTSGSIIWSAATRTLSSGGAVWDAAETEQASVPAATPALGAALQFMYQALRNKRITTATADKVHTSATGVAGTSTLSFVTGTQTFTKGKYA